MSDPLSNQWQDRNSQLDPLKPHLRGGEGRDWLWMTPLWITISPLGAPVWLIAWHKHDWSIVPTVYAWFALATVALWIAGRIMK